jgi:hypothetical protein
LKLVAFAAMTAIVVYLLVVAVRLRIDYFDSFAALQNGRYILAGDGSQYLIDRGLLFPALYAAILWVEQVTGVADFAFLTIHLMAVIIFGSLLYALYRLFRRYMAEHFAAIGALLFAMNLLLIHNGPLGKEDVPGALLITLGFHAYLKAREDKHRRFLVVAGTLIGVGISIRYNVLLLPFAVIGIYEIADTLLNGRRRWPYTPIPRDFGVLEALTLFALPVFIFFLMPVLFYPILGLDTPWHAPLKYVATLQQLATGSLIGTGEHLADLRFPRFLLESVTWPILVCAGFGAAWSVYKRHRGTLFHLIWFLVFFGEQDYIVFLKEARYLIAAFPPLYFFVARGVEGAAQIVNGRLTEKQSRLAAQCLLLAALLVIPGYAAVREVAKWTDPIYTSNYESEVSNYAVDLAAGHRVFWAGNPYAIHPADYVFDTEDPTTYIYHFFAHVASFWSRSVVYWIPVGSVAPDRSSPVALRVGPNLAASVNDGDVLIVSPYLEQQTTATVPAQVAPLVVERVRLTTFLPQGNGDYRSSDGGTLTVRTVASVVTLGGNSIQDRQYEVYALPAGAGPQSLGDVDVSGHNLEMALPSATWAAAQQASAILLLYYDSPTAFPPPGS